jgi:hypothetical protein
MAKRFLINHAHIHRDWPPGQTDMVTASDYDALAATLASYQAARVHDVDEKAWLSERMTALESRTVVCGVCNVPMTEITPGKWQHTGDCVPRHD